MEPAFWTHGPVPVRLLDRLALARPQATQACLAALQDGNIATIGGPPGSGRTTLAHQVAKQWPHAAVMLDVAATLDASQSTWAHEVLAARGVRSPPRRPSWRDVARQIRGPVLFVVDGAPPQADWLDALLADVPGAFVLIRPDGAIRPEPVPLARCRDFLQSRAAQSGTAWDETATDMVLELAEGRPDVLQRLGHACLHGRPERITQDTILDAAADLAHHLPHRDAQRLAALSPARRSLLRAMVLHRDETPTQWAIRCGLPPRSAPVHLQRLCDEDQLVERYARGRYRPTSPLIGLHIKTIHSSPVWIYRPR